MRAPVRGNLFAGEPPADGERFDPLWRTGPVLIERIVSSDVPEATLYEQARDEWVALLVGGATLELDGDLVVLRPGDWLLIPAGVPHRVLTTLSGTRWLAVHVDSAPPS